MSASERSDRPVEGHDHDPGAPGAPDAVVAARERAAYGGVKIGAAFFGWLVAVGIAVLLTAAVAATGTAIGLAEQLDVEVDEATAETIGLVGAIVLLVVMFIAYFAGGYVAGRMARFDGAKQGLAVFLWAVVIALLVALLAWLAGREYDVLQRLDAFPRIPMDTETWTTGGIIAAVLWLLAMIGGAVLGGIAGVRYHRKVDAAGREVT